MLVKTINVNICTVLRLIGGIPTRPKNISQLGLLFPIYGKNKTCSLQPLSEPAANPAYPLTCAGLEFFYFPKQQTR